MFVVLEWFVSPDDGSLGLVLNEDGLPKTFTKVEDAVKEGKKCQNYKVVEL